MIKLAFLLLVSFMMISPASAIDKSYLGQWSDTKPCDDTALSINPGGISGLDYQCKTTKSSKSKKGWTLTMSCTGEGEAGVDKISFLLLKNGHLRLTRGTRVTELRRCSGAQVAAPTKQTGAMLDTPFGRVTPKQFANKCVECFNEAMSIGRSVGGYCPANCAQVEMTCDNQGKCHVTP